MLYRESQFGVTVKGLGKKPEDLYSIPPLGMKIDWGLSLSAQPSS